MDEQNLATRSLNGNLLGSGDIEMNACCTTRELAAEEFSALMWLLGLGCVGNRLGPVAFGSVQAWV